MRVFIGIIFLGFIAHFSAVTSLAQDDSAQSGWRATVLPESAVVYDAVSPRRKAVGTLPRGEVVTLNLEITTVSGSWYSVALASSGVSGYMDGKDLGVAQIETAANWVFKPPPEPVAPSETTAEATAEADAQRSKIERDIKGFVVSQFGRTLPISAFGQSAVHNRLGFDHRNAVDVALSPDSVEGRKLVNELRLFRVPFIAFRKAVPGVATGAHIHVGRPSHRK